jgi:glycerol uptake facilitator protein
MVGARWRQTTALTLAFAARRGFPWRKVPTYVAAQLLGAFLGACLVYVVYKSAIDSYERANHIVRGDPNSVPTFSIFATFPAKYLGNWIGPFVDQVVGTAFLLAFILALTDQRNQPPRANLAPWIVGLAVVAISLSFGANAGYAINPARDFGPRLLAAIAGWGKVALPGEARSSTTSASATRSSPAASRRPRGVETRGRTVEDFE